MITFRGIQFFGKLFTILFVLISFGVNYDLSAQGRLDEQTVELFFNAIAMNETDAAKQMLESNTNLAMAVYNLTKRPLHEAAAAGNVQLVKRLLELGADINAAGDTWGTGGSKKTALHFAIQGNHREVCQLLLEAGADPNLLAFGFTTPLHQAFDERRDELADLLLDYGADPFREKGFTNDKATPFELAITRGNGVLVPRMLGQDAIRPLGAKSHVKSAPTGGPQQAFKTAANILAKRGEALLAIAAQRGELEAVQALLKAGVRVTGRTDDGSPLIHAFSQAEAAVKRNRAPSQRWEQIRELLVKNGAAYDVFAATAVGDLTQTRRLLGADHNGNRATDFNGDTPLHWAVRNDQPPLTSFWLQSGVSPAATNFAGQTALHLAASQGLVEQAKLLLAAQAPTGIRDTNSWTPLETAIHAQQSEIIRLLLQDKSTAPHPERGIANALHNAAADGNLALLATLTATPTNLEARNELGLTPLAVAVRHGHLASAAWLVDIGANVKTRDPDGNTLLHQVLLQENLSIEDRPPASWLERMARDRRKLPYLKYLAVGRDDQEPIPVLQVAGFLLACGLDAAATNVAGQTAIKMVSTMENSAIISFDDDDGKRLLQMLGTAGGNVNEVDGNGNTALHRAGQDITSDKVAALIASRADVNATNHLGRTPLHLYAEKLFTWDTVPGGTGTPFQLLLKSGAKLNLQDNEGQTPLHVLALADTSFKSEAVRALLAAGANPNVQDKHGRTAMHLFLSGPWPWNSAGECLQQLAQAKAYFFLKDDQGKTPLHYLAAQGSQNPLFFIHGLSGLLVAAKVDFQARDNEGNTPLHIAAATGTRDVFDWLLQRGAHPDTLNNQGKSARMLAARSTVPLFRMGGSLAEFDLFQAIREGNVGAATRLLNADPQLVNLTNRYQITPLRAAVTQHQTNMVSILEAHGAIWDEGSAVIAGRTDILQAILQQRPAAVGTQVQGQSLLHIAAAQGDVDTVNLLIGANAELSAKDQRSLSPLGYALIRNHSAVRDLLWQHGAKENFFDAVYANDGKTVAVLLEQDRSLASARDGENISALDIASATGYTNIIKLLLKSDAAVPSAAPGKSPNPVHLAAFYNQADSLALLIQAGAKINQADQYGLTPLHWATIRGAAQAAALLLTHQSNANQAVSYVASGPSVMDLDLAVILGATPLHLAAFCGQTNLVHLLLKAGANANATNQNRLTPLDLADNRRPMLPSHLRLIQEGMLRVQAPFGLKQAPVNQSLESGEGRQAAAALIRFAGGKHSERYQPNLNPVGTPRYSDRYRPNLKPVVSPR